MSMRCLKCGAEIEAPEVFCGDCLTDMEKAPVSRETPAVILPRPTPKVSQPRGPKAEELLEAARKRVKVLSWICGSLIVVILGLAALLIFCEKENSRPVGQTYTANVGGQTDGKP